MNIEIPGSLEVVREGGAANLVAAPGENEEKKNLLRKRALFMSASKYGSDGRLKTTGGERERQGRQKKGAIGSVICWRFLVGKEDDSNLLTLGGFNERQG